MSDSHERRIEREMLRSMEISFRSGLPFSFNSRDMADLLGRVSKIIDPKPRPVKTADLTPTLEQALQVPEVQALVDALRAIRDDQSGEWAVVVERAEAALRALEGGL